MRTVDYLLQQDVNRKRNKSDAKQTQQTPTTPPPGRQGEGIYDPKNPKYDGPAPVPESNYKPASGVQNDQEIADGMPKARKFDTLQDRLLEHQQNTANYIAAQQASAPSKPATPYQDLVRILYPEMEAKRYEEEQRKLDKKRKRDAAISAVGDGLAALSNLATVSRWAQNIDVASNTMSAKSKERYDKLQADRDARRDAYRNAMFNAAMRDRAEQIEQERTERAEQLSAANAAEQTRQFDETMRYNRERDRLNSSTKLSAAQIAANARQYAADRAAFTKKYAADRKSSKAAGNYYEIPIYDETTGELRYIRVTGNEAAKYYQNMTQADNETKHTDQRGRQSTTQKGNTSAQNNAQKAVQKAREQKLGKAPGGV